MAKDSKKQKIQFVEQALPYVIVFLLGCASAYGVRSYSDVPTKKYENYVIRKSSNGKLIAPLILGGDGYSLYEDSAFTGRVKKYVNQKTKDGAASSVSVYFKNLTTGSWTGVNENVHYAPASLMKVPILLAVLKQAESNPDLLNKKIYYDGNTDMNGNEYYKPQKTILPNHSYSVDDLLKYMIAYSDNNATVLLLSITPKIALTEIFTDLGLPIPDDNTTGAVDYLSDKLYSRLFRVLYNSTYLNEKYSEKALQILTTPDFDNGIVAKLPKDLKVANKFGERTIYNPNGSVEYRELHDCGLVYLEKSPYLLCIMTKGNDFKKLETIIQDISKIIYDNMI